MQHATSRTHESSSKTSVPENSTQISDNVTYQNRSNSNALQPSCRAQSEVLLEHDIDEVPKTKKTGKPQHPQQMPNSLNWAEAIVSLDSRTRRNPVNGTEHILAKQHIYYLLKFTFKSKQTTQQQQQEEDKLRRTYLS